MSAVEGKSKVSKEKFKRREVVKITVIRSVDFSDWFVGLKRYSALSIVKLFFVVVCLFVFSGGIVCFTMNAAQFDLPHDSFRLKCEELITSGKWKIMSQGITSLDTGKENDNKYDESPSRESYVLVFMVIDNFWNEHGLCFHARGYRRTTHGNERV